MNKKFWFLVTLVIFAFLIYYYGDRIVRFVALFILEPRAAAKCAKIGGQWEMCFLSGPCCYKEFADGGRECAGGRDCSSGICVLKIGLESTSQKAQDRFVGECRRNFTGSPYEISRPTCSEAALENGKITEDRRNERCPIY